MIKSKIVAGALAALVLSACVHSDTPIAEKETSLHQVAFSSDGLSALDARMKQFVQDGHVYGIHTRLVQGGEIVAETQYGLRDVIQKKPIEDDTIYRIYSMSKPVTGVAMMQLYDQGKWQLDDPITKFIPEFAELKVLAGQSDTGEWQYESLERPPTMAEVMSHTAGFGYGLFGDDPANVAFRNQRVLRSTDLDAMIDQVSGIPLLYQPGESWAYSIAVDIQGAIIERISGQSLGDYLEENLFTPLGMDDTGFYVPSEEYGRFSQVFGYNPEDGRLVPVPTDTVKYTKDTIAMESGGGGLVSTMDDYTAFCQMLANGGELGGVRILQPETVKLMRTDILPEGVAMWSSGNGGSYQPEGLGFGLDFGIVLDPSQRDANYGEGSFFWGGAAGTWFWIDPVNDLFFIGMIQRFPAGGPEGVEFRETSATLVYDAIAE